MKTKNAVLIIGVVGGCLLASIVTFLERTGTVIPINVSEMATWNTTRLSYIYSHYECDDVPSKVDDRPHDYDKWRQACSTIKHYHQAQLRKEKAIQYKKTFDSLTFPE